MKDFGFSHVVAFRVPEGKTRWPVRLARIGFSPTTVPALAVSPKTETVKGKPVCAWNSIEPVQLRVMASKKRLPPTADELATRLRAKRCRTSQPGPFSAFRS